MEPIAKSTEPFKRTAKCFNCGKEIPEGAPAVAVTTGTIIDGGFFMSNDPWITIACEVCGDQINEVVGDLNRAFESLG